MTLPKRYLDSASDADDFERAVLRAELDAAPPVGAEGEVFARVLGVVMPVAPGAPVEPVAGASAGGVLAKGVATLGTLGKGFALGVGVSVAAATGHHVLAEKTPTRVPTLPVVASATSAIPPRSSASPVQHAERAFAEPAETSVAEPEPRAVVPSRPEAVSQPAAADTRAPVLSPSAPSVASFAAAEDRALAASRLKEEAALLRRARAELRTGALAQAFATLEASRQRFTAPELSQEREALAIELLHRSGERAAAASRARAFLAQFPESPHAAAVRAFADAGR